MKEGIHMTKFAEEQFPVLQYIIDLQPFVGGLPIMIISNTQGLDLIDCDRDDL